MAGASRRAVIIGGGITGTLTALELARHGWSVTVLEGEHLGAGSSSRTAAGIRQQFSTADTVRGMRFSVRFYADFANHTTEGVSPIVQNGYLFLHAADDAWQTARGHVETQHAAGLTEVEVLDPAALVRRFPFVEADAIVGGTWCPTDGFLHPDVVYTGAAELAVRNGADVVQRAAVTGAVHHGGRLTGVVTPKGTYEADLFFDCTNAWTRRLAETLGAEDLPVDPLKRYLWFIRRDGPMTGEQLSALPLTVCPSGLYVRPENPDTLLMGKKHATAAEPDFDYRDQDAIEPDFSHKTGIPSVPFDLWEEVAGVLPPIAEFGGIAATTSGYYGVTPDHNPFLGYDRQVPNLVRLVGFSGHGAMFGPFTARAALALAEAGRDVEAVDLDGETGSLEAFRIGRTYADGEAMVI